MNPAVAFRSDSDMSVCRRLRELLTAVGWRLSGGIAAVLLTCGLQLVVTRPATALVPLPCLSGWQTITVTLGGDGVGSPSNYIIQTTVPNSSGCDLTTSTVITITLPGDTNAATITSGSMNGNAISFTTMTGQTVSFPAPAAVAANAAVFIALNGVTNPTTPGSKTLSMAASPTALGSISATTSSPYIVSLPTATPTATSTFTRTFTPVNTSTRTATPTATDTATETATPPPTNTLPPTSTPTFSVTPTVTNTLPPTATFTPTPGLCIGTAPGNPCVPGGGRRVTDCNMEWASTPVPTAGRSGIPSRRLICNQGDPGCDTDSDPNSCTFHIRLCFNNKDARLYPCVPSAITQFEVKSPNPQRLKDSADHANLATLEQQAGAGHFGVTVKEQAFVVFNGQPDSLLNDCTDPMNIVVPLRQLASGRKLAAHKSLRIRGTNSAGQVDTDSLRLDCRPGTSVPGTPTSTAIPSTPTNTPVNTATATPAGPTSPPTLTFTPSATNTQGAPTATPTITPTRTVSPTFPPAACGNGITEPPEECDDGGFCIGGSNAGTACTVEAQCVGNGICEGGTKVATSCASNADCPGAGGRCVHCKTFGGDGCAANCTLETGVLYKYVPGNPSNNPAPGTSYAFVHGKTLNLPLPLTGQQTLTVGAEVNNEIPFIVKASSVVLPAIRISTLACACVRAIPAKTCGGTLYESDGTPTTDCSDTYTAGPSVCTSAGKNPCTYVHGPGNSASGVIGCAGLDGINLSYTEDAGGTVDPPAPTPPAGSSPPVVVLSGSGGPGSAVALNSNAIGQTTGGSFAAANRCNGTPPAGFTDCSASDYGADCKFCTNDDPQSARGNVTTLPLVTGTAVGEIFNSGSPGSNIGPYSVNGHVFDCPALTSSTPSVTGADLAGAFTALNQQVTGDIVVVDELAAQ